MSTAEKAIRLVAGFALFLIATSFLIEGGFSRYAKYGIPPRADWRLITIGFVLAAVGAMLIRPIRHGRR